MHSMWLIAMRAADLIRSISRNSLSSSYQNLLKIVFTE